VFLLLFQLHLLRHNADQQFIMKNAHHSEAETLRQKAEELLKSKSEAQILELI
jgi:hypothetical protein